MCAAKYLEKNKEKTSFNLYFLADSVSVYYLYTPKNSTSSHFFSPQNLCVPIPGYLSAFLPCTDAIFIDDAPLPKIHTMSGTIVLVTLCSWYLGYPK